MHTKGRLLCALEHRLTPVNSFGHGHSVGTGKSGNILTAEEAKPSNPHRISPPKVTAVAYCPDGRRVACTYADSVVRIWDLALCEIVQQLHGHKDGPVWSAAFAPSGIELVTGGADKSARVWDMARHGSFAASFEGHGAAVTSIACAPDGRSFVSSSFDTSACVWYVC